MAWADSVDLNPQRCDKKGGSSIDGECIAVVKACNGMKLVVLNSSEWHLFVMGLCLTL